MNNLNYEIEEVELINPKTNEVLLTIKKDDICSAECSDISAEDMIKRHIKEKTFNPIRR